MKFRNKILILGLLPFAPFFCYGEEEKPIDPPRHEKPCSLSIKPYRIGISHTQGGGIGYDKGYSSLDFFWTQLHKDALIFLDARFHRFTNGKFAANGGIGFRYPHLLSGFAYGANLFYDYRRNNDNNFNQLGLGLEALGRIWNFRLNGYFPFGTNDVDKRYSFDKFKGYHMQLKEKSRRSLSGFDAEAEALFYSHKYIDLFLAGGPYYYNGKNNRNALGIKGRLSGRFLNIGYLAAIASYDSLFQLNFQGELGISFAFGKKHSFFRDNSLRRKTQECRYAKAMIHTLNRPVQRNEIIVIAKQRRKLVAKNPSTGNPLHFVHVNNLSSGTGTGTFSNPYNTLLGAQNGSKPGDLLYVNAGDNTFIGMDQGITLQNYQQLLGSGINQVISTHKGVISIPAFTPGFSPTITNTIALGNGVNLANNNTVSGLNITGASGHGIFASGISSASTIKWNTIIDSGGGAGAQAGIRIILPGDQIVSGTMEISNNLITSLNAGNDGIFIDNAAGPGNAGIRVNIYKNSITGNPSEAIIIQRSAGALTGDFYLSGDISYNLLQGNAQEGILVQTVAGANTSPILNLNVDSNTIATNGDDGIHFLQANGRLNVRNNFVGSNVTLGIFIETIGTDTLVGQINGNTISSNTSTVSFEVEANNTSFMNIEFKNNVARFDEMQLDVNGTATMQAQVLGNDGAFSTSGVIIFVP